MLVGDRVGWRRADTGLELGERTKGGYPGSEGVLWLERSEQMGKDRKRGQRGKESTLHGAFGWYLEGSGKPLEGWIRYS